MRYQLRLLPEVEEDALDAYFWYQRKTSKLGDGFLREFYVCVAALTYYPLRYPKVHHHFRRCLLKQYPYAVYYRIDDHQILIFGLFHGARDPRFIHMQLTQRDQDLGQ